MTRLGPYDLDSIVTGDARELTAALPDGCAALAFADPPYWVGFKYSNGITDADMEYIDPAWLAAELQRVGKVAMITPGIANIWEYPAAAWVMNWYKPGSTRRSAVLNGFNTWEPILIYGKPARRVYQDSVNLPTVSSLNDSDAGFHKCPKPLKLMAQIIESFTTPGDVVIDFVCGSATTLVAAKMAGRHYLGFEIDAKIAELSRQRLHNTQPPLFVPEPEQTALFA